MLELQNNTGEYTILQSFSIACRLKPTHDGPRCGDDPNTIRARFLAG